MGVPRFYRWLSERYPLINGPVSRSNAPPVDNFYLDMNGILHNCARSTENPLGGRSDEDIYWESCNYIDMLVTLIQPKRLLFLAVDGVAPRAKMNQQRARRYRAATALEKVAETSHQRGNTTQRLRTESEAGPDRVFDSNCITPGTTFMHGLSRALLYYVAVKLESDRSWQDLEVIVSGAEVPGEGEHKIMEYIRQLKEQKRMPPNTRHCIYGLDADLIFLGLVTHEPHFFLLREKIDFQAAFRKVRFEKVTATKMDRDIRGDFELLSLGILREYLSLEFAYLEKRLPAGVYNLERIIDDFVFVAFLVGNDFMPHSPTLEIREGALNSILFLYKELLPRFGGYLTEATGKARNPKLINFDRVEILLSKLGLLESYILEKRATVGTRGTAFIWGTDSPNDHTAIWGFSSEPTAAATASKKQRSPSCTTDPTRASLAHANNPDPDSEAPSSSPADAAASVAPERSPGNGDAAELEPEIPLWDEEALAVALEDAADAQKLQRMLSYKRRYYREKLGIDYDHDAAAVRRICRSYLEAIVWTLEYYLNGVASWRWFYPYHYAPFCSDMVGLQALAQEIRLEQGTPFLPLQQLLAVLPPRSAWCLPPAYAKLMTDTSSPLADLYPSQVAIDMQGKRNEWEGIVLLPFMDENRLFAALASVPPDALTPTEQERNHLGSCILLRYRPQEGTSNEHTDAVLSAASGIGSSPFPSRMARSLSACVQMESLSLQHERGFVPRLPPGTRPAADKAVGHPSLLRRDVTHCFENVAIDVFGVPSRLESCIICMETPQAWHEAHAAQACANAFLSGVADAGAAVSSLDQSRTGLMVPVHMGFPWQSPALLEAVESATERVTWDANKALIIERNDPQRFRQTDTTLLAELLQRRGICLDKNSLHGRVRRIVEIAAGGGVTDAATAESFPLELIEAIDSKEGNEASSSTELKPGDTVIYVGRRHGENARYFGCRAQVVAIRAAKLARKRKQASDDQVDTQVVIRVLESPLVPIPALKEIVARNDAVQYAPLPVALRRAGLEGVISLRFAGMLTGKVRCRIPKHERFGDLLEVNLGLGLRFKREKLVVPGYVVYRPVQERPAGGTTAGNAPQASEGTFLFAPEPTARLLRSYHETFPGLLERMDEIVTKRGDGDLVLKAVELFGTAQWPDMVARIQTFLRSLESARLPLVRVTSRVLTQDIVTDIQTQIQRIASERSASFPAETPPVEAATPPTAPTLVCLRSEVLPGFPAVATSTSGLVTPFSAYELGDRVLYVGRSGAVPFGARGVVVGIHPPSREVDVVFDQDFIGGSDLQGRCRGCAGKTLDAETTLLNLSRLPSEHRSSQPTKSAHPVPVARQRDAPLRKMPRAPPSERTHSEKSHERVKVRGNAGMRTADLLPGTSRATVDAHHRQSLNTSTGRSKDTTRRRAGRREPHEVRSSHQGDGKRAADTGRFRTRPQGPLPSRQDAHRATPAGHTHMSGAGASTATLSIPVSADSQVHGAVVGQSASSPHRAQVADEMSLYLKQLLRIDGQGMVPPPPPSARHT
jgi:5'-3' exoribonuclease 1